MSVRYEDKPRYCHMKSTLPNSFNLIMNSLVEYSQVECVCP